MKIIAEIPEVRKIIVIPPNATREQIEVLVQKYFEEHYHIQAAQITGYPPEFTGDVVIEDGEPDDESCQQRKASLHSPDLTSVQTR